MFYKSKCCQLCCLFFKTVSTNLAANCESFNFYHMGGIEKTPHSENEQTEGSYKPRRQPSLNRAFDVRSLDSSAPKLFCFHADSEDSLHT